MCFRLPRRACFGFAQLQTSLPTMTASWSEFSYFFCKDEGFILHFKRLWLLYQTLISWPKIWSPLLLSLLLAAQITMWNSSGISSSSWTLWTTEVWFIYGGSEWTLPSFHLKCVVFVVLAAARNHVNRMCLAADIPLIESGTAGYLGQVTVIKKARLFC